MRFGGLLTAVVVLAGTLAATVTAPAHAAKAGDFRITAHRGAPTRDITENTIRSMRRAVRLKASALETDIRMTKDGQVVLMHDPTLDRTTDCSGRVSDRSMHYLRKRCRGNRGAEMVPTLGAVLRLADKHHVNLLMEFKGDHWPKADVARVNEVIVGVGMQARVTAMSFHPVPLRRTEAINPGIDTTLLVRRWAQVDAALTYADGVTLATGEMTAERVTAIHGVGKRVIAKKANNTTRWKQLKRLDVGDLITDRVSGYRNWLRR
ncbi:glycerophosphodiester phosphodiesterase family protein [Nocardioides sp. InS609-2]|uniref:glycerophosphodiester phosphodiesterase n=1 Tax=Nocardioides sp. InS609-2 TaxID=2760705 RepID=UPI0020BF8684|nr:glycerophosphodiester phosphodiesterase family protein [Nocardioides sp. InS609-2]